MSTNHNGAVSLEWVQATGGAWELLDDTLVRARLAPRDRAWIGTAGNEAWTVLRVGFHRPRLVVRPMGALAEIAHLQHDWHGHGVLCTASGACYEVDRSPAAGLVIRTPDRRPVVRAAWNGRDCAAARVHVDGMEMSGPHGTVLLLIAGSLLIDERRDASRPLSIGAPLGPTVRARFA